MLAGKSIPIRESACYVTTVHTDSMESGNATSRPDSAFVASSLVTSVFALDQGAVAIPRHSPRLTKRDTQWGLTCDVLRDES